MKTLVLLDHIYSLVLLNELVRLILNKVERAHRFRNVAALHKPERNEFVFVDVLYIEAVRQCRHHIHVLAVLFLVRIH